MVEISVILGLLMSDYEQQQRRVTGNAGTVEDRIAKGRIEDESQLNQGDDITSHFG